MTPEEEKEFRRRQKSRNLVLGGLLLFMALLFYAITIVRM
ncbi:cytochrome C oxidase assembly protein [Erythrobacter sp. SD-21]|nr:cytochrome C oxidase assembly protein [Erythrobacter sp. SD-21]